MPSFAGAAAAESDTVRIDRRPSCRQLFVFYNYIVPEIKELPFVRGLSRRKVWFSWEARALFSQTRRASMRRCAARARACSIVYTVLDLSQVICIYYKFYRVLPRTLSWGTLVVKSILVAISFFEKKKIVQKSIGEPLWQVAFPTSVVACWNQSTEMARRGDCAGRWDRKELDRSFRFRFTPSFRRRLELFISFNQLASCSVVFRSSGRTAASKRRDPYTVRSPCGGELRFSASAGRVSGVVTGCVAGATSHLSQQEVQRTDYTPTLTRRERREEGGAVEWSFLSDSVTQKFWSD